MFGRSDRPTDNVRLVGLDGVPGSRYGLAIARLRQAMDPMCRQVLEVGYLSIHQLGITKRLGLPSQVSARAGQSIAYAVRGNYMSGEVWICSSSCIEKVLQTKTACKLTRFQDKETKYEYH